MTHPIIPAAALQQHIAVLGKSGSGKTYAAKSVIVEPLLAAGKRVCVVDPTSAWWGLRSSADGRGAGFKVLVLGGDHGDLPLPSLGGAAVARLVVQQGVNLVADTGFMSVGERTRWMIDFAGTLYRLNHSPLHLVLDEAHVFAPQGGGGRGADADANKMLHAVNQIAAGGRSRGIRLTMLTQRPQKLHKDALTTADTLIATRVLAPHDRDAVKAWIDGCGVPAQGREVLDSLAGLQRGEGWVWYPEGGVLHRVHFPAIKTFDSSATPKDGDIGATPRGSAEIDLTEIKAALADAVKEAEANDPKRLRAKIAELERERAKPAQNVDAATLTREYERGASDSRAELRPLLDPIIAKMSAWGNDIIAVANVLNGLLRSDAPQNANSRQAPAPTRILPPLSNGAPKRKVDAPLDSSVGTGGLRRILIALAQRPGMTNRQIGIRAGLSTKGGTFTTYMSRARTAGWLVSDCGRSQLTHEGLAALGAYEPLPTGQALLAYWLGELGESGAARILRVLADAYPHEIAHAEIGNQAAMSAAGGTFTTYMSRLRTMDLITTDRGRSKASAELFD